MNSDGKAQDGSPSTASTVPTSAAGILNNPIVKNVMPFVIGGLSGCVGTTCIQPADVVKVRLQLAGEGSKGAAQSPIAVARHIVADGKVTDLWAGLSAGYLRQLTYATMRLGFFDRFLTLFETSAKSRGKQVGFTERAAASLSAGGLAAALSNPAEVALVRMQSDGMKPKDQRANYRSVVDALVRVARAEGIRGLWSGSYPTIVRAMATNFGQLAFFSESKSQLEKHTDLSFRSRTVVASAIAGFFAAFFSLPFDFMKTRLQRDSKTYKGLLDVAGKVLKEEGPLRFYRGFGTYFVRIAPHSIITLIVADNANAWVKSKQNSEV